MWCDTAHQELVKVIVLQSAVYSCEKIPDTLHRRLTLCARFIPSSAVHMWIISVVDIGDTVHLSGYCIFTSHSSKLFVLLLILRS